MDEQNNVSQQETVQEAPVQDNPEVSSAQTEKEKVRSSKNKKVWTLATLIVAAVVVVLAIAGVLVGVYRYNSPEAVAVRYVETMDKDNEKAASLLAYDEKAKLLYNYDGDQTAFFEKNENTFDMDIESWEDYYSAEDEFWTELTENLCGEYEVTAEATRTKKMSIKRLEKEQGELLDELEDKAGFNRDAIQEVKEITVKRKLKGEVKTWRDTYAVIMVKLKGKWRVLEWESNK